MIEFLFLGTLSTLFSGFFLWIEIQWLALLPIIFMLLYSISFLSSFSLPNFTKDIVKNNGVIIARSLILIGIIILLINQWLVWYHVIMITTIFNALLFYSSYKRDYNEGKSLFSRWIIITQCMGIVYAIRTGNYDSISYMASLWSIILLGIYYSIPLLFQLNEIDKNIISQQQEIALYACIYVLLYRIFEPNYSAIIVTQLWFTSFLIAIRQNYLTTKNTVLSKKRDWLNGRALLSWQKVLERYDNNTKSFSITFFTSLIKNGYMPSEFGMRILQYTQLISISILVIISIIGAINNIWYTLIRYWLGILCFIITLFGIQSQEKFISYYKPIALTLITGAYYITLFDNTSTGSIFTRWSLAWLCINMITCLFHQELFPASKSLFSHKDILFWLSMIIISSVISILSLIRLPLSGDVLFALGCIIIGMVSFFSYHIWRWQYHRPLKNI
jgi:hypothetical protein